VLADAGIAVLRSPPRAPKANPYVERSVSTVRRVRLDRVLIFYEPQLAHVLTEYENHYNMHRPHRALEQRAPMEVGANRLSRSTGVVRRTQILGSLINEYLDAA
jgi:putative transposase